MDRAPLLAVWLNVLLENSGSVPVNTSCDEWMPVALGSAVRPRLGLQSRRKEGGGGGGGRRGGGEPPLFFWHHGVNQPELFLIGVGLKCADL